MRYLPFAILVILVLAGCGDTPSSDPFDLPSGPTHQDLVSAAKAAGFTECGQPDDQGLMICSTPGDPQQVETQSIEIVDGNDESATSEYKKACGRSGSAQPVWNVWFDGSDWAVAVTEDFLDQADVKAISDKLGDEGCDS